MARIGRLAFATARPVRAQCKATPLKSISGCQLSINCFAIHSNIQRSSNTHCINRNHSTTVQYNIPTLIMSFTWINEDPRNYYADSARYREPEVDRAAHRARYLSRSNRALHALRQHESRYSDPFAYHPVETMNAEHRRGNHDNSNTRRSSRYDHHATANLLAGRTPVNHLYFATAPLDRDVRRGTARQANYASLEVPGTRVFRVGGDYGLQRMTRREAEETEAASWARR